LFGFPPSAAHYQQQNVHQSRGKALKGRTLTGGQGSSHFMVGLGVWLFGLRPGFWGRAPVIELG